MQDAEVCEQRSDEGNAATKATQRRRQRSDEGNAAGYPLQSNGSGIFQRELKKEVL
jgi:hypothetical protein